MKRLLGFDEQHRISVFCPVLGSASRTPCFLLSYHSSCSTPLTLAPTCQVCLEALQPLSLSIHTQGGADTHLHMCRKNTSTKK